MIHPVESSTWFCYPIYKCKLKNFFKVFFSTTLYFFFFASFCMAFAFSLRYMKYRDMENRVGLILDLILGYNCSSIQHCIPKTIEIMRSVIIAFNFWYLLSVYFSYHFAVNSGASFVGLIIIAQAPEWSAMSSNPANYNIFIKTNIKTFLNFVHSFG